MSYFQKSVLIVFFLLLFYDLYDCTVMGLETSIWLRPAQMLVLMFFVIPQQLTLLESSFISISLLITTITEHIFYSTGLVHQNLLITLLLIKNLCFIFVLQNTKNQLRFSLKFFRWILTYIIISITICSLVVGKENWFYYILAIQSGMLLLLISLQVKSLGLFRQLYLGYALIILAMIFGKILVSDFRWFIEIITRLSIISGHLLFISSLANIKILPDRTNISGYNIVE
jgi:hypothetical protein